MRTLLLVGIAGIAALTADAAHANHGAETTRVERRVIVVDGTSRGDEAVYRSGDDRVLAESDYRGRWDGEWSGDWDDSRETYEGTYRGRYDRGYESDHDDRAHSRRRTRHQERREVRYSDDDLARICRRDDGVGGAAIGAVVGGVAGNRIAGRGDRTAGTLLGAAGGAILGAVIDRAEDGRCNDYWRRADSEGGYRHREYRHDSRRDDRGGYDYRSGYDYRGDYGRQGGYYETAYSEGGYYGGGTTTIVIPGQPTIIEETETTYETVTLAAPRARTAPRRHARRALARPRPRCVCR